MRLAPIFLVFAFLFFPVVLSAQNEGGEVRENRKRFGIVVDNSGTFRLAIDRAVRLLSPFIREKDNNSIGFLITFSEPSRIALKQEPTTDREEFIDALENMYVMPGRSAVWDAIESAAEQFALADMVKGERRFLVVITDGDEKGSIARPASVISRLRELEIEVIVVGMAEQRVSERMIDRLVKDTGGKKLLARTNDELLAAATALNELVWRGDQQ